MFFVSWTRAPTKIGTGAGSQASWRGPRKFAGLIRSPRTTVRGAWSGKKGVVDVCSRRLGDDHEHRPGPGGAGTGVRGGRDAPSRPGRPTHPQRPENAPGRPGTRDAPGTPPGTPSGRPWGFASFWGCPFEGP